MAFHTIAILGVSMMVGAVAIAFNFRQRSENF